MRSHRCPSWAILVVMSVLPILSACGSDQSAPVPGINGMLVYDSANSVFPAQEPPPDGDGLRHPANYNLTGTLKPPA